MNSLICPLFDTLVKCQQISPMTYPVVAQMYPDVDAFLTKLNIDTAQEEYLAVLRILMASGRRSVETFNRFRSDIEKYLLFMWCIRQKSILNPTRSDVDAFVDFFVAPDESWIGEASADRFHLKNGQYVVNEAWKPYVAKKSKAIRKLQGPDAKSERNCSEATINACYSALSRLFNGLVEEGYSTPNWVSVSKRYSPYLIKRQSKNPVVSGKRAVKRFSDEEWDFLLDVATELAEQDAEHERKLFVLSCLKSLYLRVSELSTNHGRSPIFDDFSKDHNGTWFLTVIGKGNKERHVSIPNSFLDNLKRYRQYRGLPPLPVPGEKALIIENTRRKGGVTSRTLINDCQFVFNAAFEQFKERFGEERAKAFLVSSSHWLRHTGASMTALNDNVSAKDLAEELGHADSRTTDTVYIKNSTSDRGARLRDRSM